MTVSDVEAIRLRPGMYVGGVDESGIHHLLWELVANALDEHAAGRCTRIEIEARDDGSIAVMDDGAGIRLDEVEGVSFAERALTTMHRGPTLDGHAPHEHLVFPGVGLVVVCALSAWLSLDVHRDGRHRTQRFERGRAVSPCRDVGASIQTGTHVAFFPDPQIFTTTSLNPGVVLRRLQELSYLQPRLTLQFRDLRTHVFHEPKGLLAYIHARAARTWGSSLPPFHTRVEEEDIVVEVALTWGNPWQESVESFANVYPTTGGGTHVRGLRLGLLAAIRAAIPTARGQSTRALERAIAPGLIAAVCVRLNDPSFGAPTKDELSTPRVATVVKCVLTKELARHIVDHPALRDFIDERIRGSSG